MPIELANAAPRRWLFAAALAMTAFLGGCSNQAISPGGTLSAVDANQPVRLHAGGPGIAGEKTSILFPIDAKSAKRAINNYRINKRGKESPYIYKGVDLNGDGRAEIIAYLSGKSWCAKTGCTLAILTPGNHGYRTVTTIRRVKLPVSISRESLRGWRTIIVNTGGAGMPLQTVALKFSGKGYPGNATLLAPIPMGGDIGAETIFAKGERPGQILGQVPRKPPTTAFSSKPQSAPNP